MIQTPADCSDEMCEAFGILAAEIEPHLLHLHATGLIEGLKDEEIKISDLGRRLLAANPRA